MSERDGLVEHFVMVQDAMFAYKRRTKAAEAEVVRLKHDIARHVQIATDLNSEVERLKGVLGEIVGTLKGAPDDEGVKALYDFASSALKAKP